MPQIARGSEWFIDENEKQAHFDSYDKNDQNKAEELKDRFRTHYRGEIEYSDLYKEINDLLERGKKVPEAKKFMAEKYKDIINEYDLFDLLTEVVISRQVGHEKKRFNYDDRKNKDAT